MPETTTRRERIILALLARVAKIKIANGYKSNIGNNPLRAKMKIDIDELPAVAVWPMKEETTKSYGKSITAMPVKIQGLKKYGSSTPSEIAEEMLGDIIENILGTEWTLPFTDGEEEVSVGDFLTGATGGAVGYVTGIDISSGTWGGNDAAGNFTLRRVTGTYQAEILKVGVTNVAVTSGIVTITENRENSTNNLADRIEYAEGGPDEYPEAKTLTVGVEALFNIFYEIDRGNPYT